MYSAHIVHNPLDNLKRRPSYIMCSMYHAFGLDGLDIDSHFGIARRATTKAPDMPPNAIMSNIFLVVISSFIRFLYRHCKLRPFNIEKKKTTQWGREVGRN